MSDEESETDSLIDSSDQSPKGSTLKKNLLGGKTVKMPKISKPIRRSQAPSKKGMLGLDNEIKASKIK